MGERSDQKVGGRFNIRENISTRCVCDTQMPFAAQVKIW